MYVFDVSFTRTEKGFVTVSANSEEEANEKAIAAYHRGEAGFDDEEITDMKADKVERK